MIEFDWLLGIWRWLMSRLCLFLLIVVCLMLGGCQIFSKSYELKDFEGIWVSEDNTFRVIIETSGKINQINLTISDSNLSFGNDLDAELVDSNMLEVLAPNDNTLYTFRFREKDKISFYFSSIKANKEKVPSISAPMILKKDYSNE